MISIVGLEELDTFIIDNTDKIVLLYFGANYCKPCRILKERIINEGSAEMPKLLYPASGFYLNLKRIPTRLM